MKDAFLAGADDFGLRRLEGIVRALLVAAGDGFLHLADGSAHARAPDFVDFCFSHDLARGLFGRCGSGHGSFRLSDTIADPPFAFAPVSL